MMNDYEFKSDVCKIFLKRRDGSIVTTIIDSEDFKRVNEFPNTWYASKNKMGTFYVFGEVASGSRIYGTFKKKTHLLHRYIMEPPKGLVVDHINHDTLDNRKNNLRILTTAENNQNKSATHIPGVHPYFYDTSRWIAYCRANGKTNNLGIFDTKEQAEKAVITFKKKHHKYSKEAEKHDVSQGQ